MRVTGLQPERRITAVRDCVAILTGVSATQSLNYAGQVYSLTDYLPEWATAPAPLIYVGATGPRMLRMGASVADGIMMSDVPLARMEEVNQFIDGGLTDAGRQRSGFRVNNFFAWHIKPDAAESFAEARQGLIWRGFLQEWHISTFLDPHECAQVAAHRPAFLEAFLKRRDSIEGVSSSIVDALVSNLTFSGGLDAIHTVIDDLRSFARAGLTEVALKVHGNPRQAIQMIGERLVPALAG